MEARLEPSPTPPALVPAFKPWPVHGLPCMALYLTDPGVASPCAQGLPHPCSLAGVWQTLTDPFSIAAPAPLSLPGSGYHFHC